MQERFRREHITLPLPTAASFTAGVEPTFTPIVFAAGPPPTLTGGVFTAGTLPAQTYGLAAGVGQATWNVERPVSVSGAQLCLSDTGTGAGNTTVNIKQNGTLIATISIAGAAGSKSAKTPISSPQSQFPSGVRLNVGDVITIDVAAVPATTSPKAGAVVLDVYELDV